MLYGIYSFNLLYLWISFLTLQFLQDNSLPETNGFILKSRSKEEQKNIINGVAKGRRVSVNLPDEDVAAIRIQTAFRGFKVFLHLAISKSLKCPLAEILWTKVIIFYICDDDNTKVGQLTSRVRKKFFIWT